MKVSVLDIQGKDTGRKVELSDAVYGIEPNNHAVYLDVKQYLANKRQGTHKAKERAEIIKSPVFRGGGRVFGPRPKDYSFKLNKNLKRLARKSALSIQAKENNIIVVEDFNFESPKTKNFAAVLQAFGLENKKSILVLAESNNNVYLSSRNLKSTKTVTNSGLSTYELLNANKVILSEGALEGIESNLSK